MKLNIISFFILIFFSFILCEEDYYKILGLNRGATEKDIKRAFKKLSLKYHPDKNRENPEKAKVMFSRIVNAYEILKDPEQKQIYDSKGEEGVRQHSANKAQQEQYQNQGFGGFQGGFRFQSGGGGNFEDIFSNFFGGGQRQNRQEQRQEAFFENTDVYEINLGSLSRFFRRTDVWIIFFYRPEEKECQEIKDKWKELAEKYFGIFKVAAVNCQAEQELCEDEFQIFETPRILAYSSALNHEGLLFKGDVKNAQLLANFAVSLMESYVQFLSKENFQEFVESEPDKHKVLLFTAKKTTPPLFKAISKDLKGKLLFGEIRQNNAELIERFKITKIPTLLVLTDSEKSIGVVYEDVYKKDAIMRFLREYAYTSKKKKNTKSDKGEALEITKSSLKISQKCGGSDPNLCFLMILPHGSHPNLMDLLKNIAIIYEDDPINFYYLHEQNLNHAELFNNGIKSFPSITIIRGKRMRYSKFEGDLTMEKVKDFIDQTLGGSSHFQKLNISLENALLEDADIKSEL